MKKDLFKKIVSFLAALLMISVLTFLLAKLSSADQAENYLRVSKIQVTPQSLEKAREYLGLNQPWPQQYLAWLTKALRGDFGTSYLLKVPVLPLVLERFQSTLSLGLTSFALILLTSIPLGIFSAVYKDSLFDKVTRFLSFSSVSMPSFWLGYMLIVIFAVQLRWLPVSGKQDLSSLILPSLTLSMSLIGQYIALIRKAVLEQMNSVHVENALLRGVSKFFLVKNHLLRNSLPAIATGLSLTLVYLLTGSLIVEEVFSKEFGSYMFLGELITNLDIEPDQPVDYGCGDCNRCVTACPTSCLIGDGSMNAKRCLSFQTQDKGVMDLEFRKKIKTVIYGCDICQICCPYNKGLDNPLATEIDPDLSHPELLPFLELSNGQFKEKFGHVAGSWRGKNILQRNAIIALANANDRSAIPKMLEIIDKGQNPIHVSTAIWALSQLVREVHPEMIELVMNVKNPTPQIQEEQGRFLEKFGLEEKLVLEN